VNITTPPEGYVLIDTITVVVTTTGPFTASWATGDPAQAAALHPWYRVLTIQASGPGNGIVSVTADGKTASIMMTAVALGFQSITAAYGYACGIALDQRAWCWGANDSGELGMTTTYDCNGGACQYGGNSGNATPLPVAGNQQFTQVAASGVSCALGYVLDATCGHTCALTAARTAFCWGDGYGEPPRPDGTPGNFQSQIASGVALSALSVSELSDTHSQSCGLSAQGAGYCFPPVACVGCGLSFTTVSVGNGMTFTSFSVGSYHSCGVATDGNVYCWGSNARGNLGIGSVDTLAHPTPVQAIASVKFTSVVVGGYSTCALDTSGTVQCWGQGYSATGVSPPAACPGTTALCQTTPRPIEGGGTYAAFSRAQNSSRLCGLTSGGSVSCWTSFNNEPSAVSVPEPLVNISVGAFLGMTGCGVAASHVAYCWGSNYVGSKVGQ
jgi:hypothetical protein